jgi:hypothetical protein
VVQAAAKIVLEPIFEADFEDTAYGYRPKRGAVDAVKAVHRHLCRGHTDAVDALRSTTRRATDLRSSECGIESKYLDKTPAAIIIRLGDPPILTLIAALLIQIVARYALPRS